MYESELYDLLVGEIQYLYGLNNESEAFKYFYLRFLIDGNDPNEVNYYRLARFLLKELNVFMEEDFFTYKGVKVSVNDTIYNIIINWEFRASLVSSEEILNRVFVDVFEQFGKQNIPLNIFIKEIYIEIRSRAMKKAKKFKKTGDYKIYYKYYGLKALNSIFKATVGHCRLFKDISYSDTHNQFKRSLEEELEAIIHSVEFSSNNVVLIEEKKVEDFIIQNLRIIEDDLKFVERQVSVDGGRLDILAKDKNNVYTIIEVKVDEDKELIWQSIYYPKAIKDKFKANKVRMLTLCPNYSPHMLKALKELENVEIIQYVPQLCLGNIESIDIFKIR